MKKRLLQRQNRKDRIHRQVKDRLFRFLFEKDRESLLELYNALNGTDYADVSELHVVTIENQMIAQEAAVSIYSTRQIMLPTPNCIVFYNGYGREPEEQILHLSDAFENKRQKGDAELSVRMLNINYGHNKELMEKCRMLKEYAAFVNTAKKYVSEAEDRKEALENAIEYCMENDILKGFLQKYRMEVLGMLLEEFDVEKYERTMREDGREEGRIEGITEGEEEMRKAFLRACHEIGLEEKIILKLESQVKAYHDNNLPS